MLDRSGSSLFDDGQKQFRESVRTFLKREFTPYLDRFEADRKVSRELWLAAGSIGLLCPDLPAEFGGLGLDFRYNAIINEEFSYAMMPDCLTLQTDITAPYILRYADPDIKSSLLPKMVTGEAITAIAMTEPGAGSDLKAIRTTARRDADQYVINGSKTFITNGQNADLILTVCTTDPRAGAKGLSILLVEASSVGFERGRNLEKIGHWSADTSELFFNDVSVPVGNLIGTENRAFSYLVSELPQERLSISISAQAAAQRAYDEALGFVKGREAFGRPIFDFQNTRFTLADAAARLQVGWAHLDWAIARHVAGVLSPEQAAASKYWHTETQWLICDLALQLHGGSGYMNDSAISRIWRDARARRIYGGSSEIMLELLSRSL